jgi:cytochrome b6-f complex iron-sulfur subunit
MTLSLGGVTYLFAMPRFKEGEFGGTFDVGTPSELPGTEDSPANYPKGKFWLTNTEAGVLALYKVCTHLGCLYSWSEQEFRFKCPCHGSQFEKDGQFIQGPAPRNLDLFVVQAVDAQTGEVLSETPPNGGPMKLPENEENVRILVDTGQKIQGKPK